MCRMCVSNRVSSGRIDGKYLFKQQPHRSSTHIPADIWYHFTNIYARLCTRDDLFDWMNLHKISYLTAMVVLIARVHQLYIKVFHTSQAGNRHLVHTVHKICGNVNTQAHKVTHCAADPHPRIRPPSPPSYATSTTRDFELSSRIYFPRSHHMYRVHNKQ